MRRLTWLDAFTSRSLAGPLCAHVHARTGATRPEISQGVAIGRPSVLRCVVGDRVRVEGETVIPADGTLRL